MNRRLRGYKLCKECGQPMLKRGQKRRHPDDYRHASGCPLDPYPVLSRRSLDRPTLVMVRKSSDGESVYACSECEWVGTIDDFDVGGADEGCVFCNGCNAKLHFQ